MRKMIFAILSAILIVSCSNDMNLPETNVNSVGKTENNSLDGDAKGRDVIKTFGFDIYSPLGFGASILSNAPNNLLINAEAYGNVEVIGRVYTNDGITTKDISIGSEKFFVNPSGQIISVNGLEATKCENYSIMSDGKTFAPKRIAIWRGELNEDPPGGFSGDTYWNIPAKEKRIFIQAEGRWIKD